MATVMSHLNVTIFDGAKRLTHWRGSPSSSGGELKMIDSSPVGGPPQMDWDTTGQDRKPYSFDVETDILGADKTAQDAFILTYKQGTLFSSTNISGLPTGVNFVVSEANVTHNRDESPSLLKLKLMEVGSANGGVPIVTPPGP